MTDKRIRIILDSKGAKRNADELNQSVRGVGDSAEKSQFSVNKLAAAIAAVISVQKIAQFADAFTRVQNQLTRTVSSTQELAAATQQLLDVANQTRAGIEPTVELYTALTVSTKDLAISQSELVGVTKTINNLFLESGKGAAETAGAIRQLGQALESGALRGDEFNSVAEGAPGILRAIQQETGLTRAELRGLAEQGQITAELIVRSLQNYSEEAQNAADKTQVTLAQAFTVANNNLTNFIGQINDATGASSAFAGAIIDLTNYIGSPEFISGVLQAFNTAKLTINSVSDSVGDLSNEIQLLKDTGGGAVGLLGEAFKNLLPNIKSLIQIVTVEAASAFDKLRISGTALFKIFSDPFDVANLKASMAEYNLQMDAVNEARRSSIEDSLKERETVIETAKKSAEAYAQQAAARKAVRDGGGDIGIASSGVPSAPGKKAEVDNGEREIASAQSVTRSLEQELALRRQVAEIYRSNELSADASFYEQQLAQIQIREAEERAIAQAKFSEESAQREERLAATLENDKLTQEARAALKAEFDAQEILAAQILEQEKTAIQEEATNARIELDRAEWQARLDNAGALGNSLMALGQGQSKKIFKIGQTLALAQAAVALPTAVLESFKNGGGYPWGLIPAGAMLATGLKNIQQIKSAGAGLGGGGGGSVPTPSLGGGASGGAPSIPNTASGQQVEQRRVYELRGVAGNDKITVDQFRELMEQDGAVVVLSDSVNDASRRNVVGVTAR
jgi:tape measure domain-containing protein